jgi:uncharacterized protein with ATP-grasp and redox domains
MAVRVPAIIDEVLSRNPDYSHEIVTALSELRDGIRSGAPLPQVAAMAPHGLTWRKEVLSRSGQGWLDTDWFFAETYAYRQLAERVGYFANERDPFAAYKREEYASSAHAEAFGRALRAAGEPRERALALLGLALFANRMDLSFAASRAHGSHVNDDDLLCDERPEAVELLLAGSGPVHLILDNAGTELTLDLVLVDFLLNTLRAEVVLHAKLHPTFVSDATQSDILRFLAARSDIDYVVKDLERSCLTRLAAALARGKLRIFSHPFWNEPHSLWDLAGDLRAQFRGARLVILKGDANYRRALGDALWPPETAFRDVTANFPAPLLALRTLKSDPIVGLRSTQVDVLERQDPSWRVNGKRAVASLGGLLPRGGA